MKYIIIFIASILFLIISSINQSYAYTGGGGQFGGAGASGEWDSPIQCPLQFGYTIGNYPSLGFFPDVDSAAAALIRSVESQDKLKVTSYSVHSDNCVYGNGINSLGQDFSNAVFACLSQSNNPDYHPDCEEKCPAGYEKVNGKCQPKKCPVGQTLINGKCVEKKCPAGQALDKNGNCMPPDDQCPAGQQKINGRCITPPPDDPDDPDSEWPPFCEWASEMCIWHKEWIQWSNDYAANEEKANLDREELKRIGLDSKENLDEINQKMTEQNQKLDEHKIRLDEIKNQDKQFYDELRLWLKNYNEKGDPSEENPSIEFPKFCDWSVELCNWYLDWKDWRDDYNAHNEEVLNRFDEYLAKLEEQKIRDEQFYQDWEVAASNVVGNQQKQLDQDKEFQDEVRDFFDWFKDQKDENDPDPFPESPDSDTNFIDDPLVDTQTTHYIQGVQGCPVDRVIPIHLSSYSTDIVISYAPLCQAAAMFRPFVILMSFLAGAFIITNTGRRAETGD